MEAQQEKVTEYSDDRGDKKNSETTWKSFQREVSKEHTCEREGRVEMNTHPVWLVARPVGQREVIWRNIRGAWDQAGS